MGGRASGRVTSGRVGGDLERDETAAAPRKCQPPPRTFTLPPTTRFYVCHPFYFSPPNSHARARDTIIVHLLLRFSRGVGTRYYYNTHTIVYYSAPPQPRFRQTLTRRRPTGLFPLRFFFLSSRPRDYSIIIL